MNDAADHPPVIYSRLAPRVGGEMRSNLGKLLVRQPEWESSALLSEAVNYNAWVMPSNLWLWTLRRIAPQGRHAEKRTSSLVATLHDTSTKLQCVTQHVDRSCWSQQQRSASRTLDRLCYASMLAPRWRKNLCAVRHEDHF